MAFDLTAWFNIARHLSETENTILLGQQDEGYIAGLQERSGTASKTNSGDNQKQETKDKKFSDLLDTIQSIQDYMDHLAKSIEKMEDTFRQRDGDEWREKLALKILSEDDIPQQEPGENIEAYRERMEILLINEMLNPDGSIKTKYKNHPELSDYAEWAQKQYHLNSARAAVNELKNPHTTPERRNEILDELKQHNNFEELTFADREADLNGDAQSAIKDHADSARVEKHNSVQSTETANNFLKPIS